MNRSEAWALVGEYTQSPHLRRHMLAVEAAMRGYARYFGEDEEKWGLVGLLHDFDYERYKTIIVPHSLRKIDFIGKNCGFLVQDCPENLQ